MAQNTSSAVMQQRSEARESLDDFPTPPWAVRALIKHVIWPNSGVYAPEIATLRQSVWEPASNRGYMAKPLEEFFGRVTATDVHDYGDDSATVRRQDFVADFLIRGLEPASILEGGVDWIITNPPFRLAEQFFSRACEIRPDGGIALLVRTSFLEGVGRWRDLFNVSPPSFVAQFAERVPMVRGRLDGTASTATSYCWLVWMMGEEGTRFVWIPPCRKHLERAGDYPTITAEAA